jgi:hypothetical protein
LTLFVVDSKSLDDLTIEELVALPKWAVPPRLQKKIEEAFADENRDRIKKADVAAAPEAFHDPKGYWPARTRDAKGSREGRDDQTAYSLNSFKIGPRGGRYRIRFNSEGNPYRQYF